MNVVPDLGAVQIRLRDDCYPGEHRTACPECARTKRRPGDTALAVKIDGDGSKWCCYRCDWHGAIWRCRDCDKGRSTEQPHECICRSCGRPRIIGEPHKCQEQGDERDHHAGDQRDLGEQRPRPRSRPAAPKSDNRERAQEIWRETVDIPPGELAHAYLTQRRGITSWDPDTVRWHPECPWERGTAGCIVCPVTSHAIGYTVAIWRIWPSMTEPMKERRMGLGPTKGSACQLFWPEVGDELAVAEGVENALAFQQLHGIPCWSALSAGNMAKLILPRRLGAVDLRRIVIVQDNDIAGPGPKAAQDLAKRLRSEGRSVRIVASDHGKDANDALLQRRAS